ncbi:MAG: FAD:protein FMN transferase [Steroidobacteraceae bacterium]
MRLAPPLVAVVLLAGGCAPSPQQFDGPTMGTTYSITVTRLPGGVTRERLQGVIDDVLAQVDRHLSTWNPASEISKFNSTRSTVPIPISPDLRAVVEVSLDVSRASGGAFDITVAPLVHAWGFGSGQGAGVTSPDRPPLDQLRASTGYRNLVLAPDGRTLQKVVPALELDVAGVAPGYAVDLIAERFDQLGVRDYLIELGGELRGRGHSPEGRPWRVAVESPLTGERKPYALVEVDGMAVSTSGDYRDFRIVGGRRVSHEIDPRTGAPATSDLASVCVLHPSDAYADAYATALMVLGPDAGMTLATRLGLAALFIERDHTGHGFRERSTPQFERLRRSLD